MDLRIGDNKETELSELIQDNSTSPFDSVEQDLMFQEVRSGEACQRSRSILSKLSPNEQEVLYLRFGLKDGKELSRAKIAQKLNLSCGQIRHLEQQALAHLRRQYSPVLRDYFA